MRKAVAALGAFFMLTGSVLAADLSKFAGTYRGFAPTDESAIMYGELEVTITSEKMVMRMATGHNIDSEEMPASAFDVASAEDIARQWKPTSPYIVRTEGIKLRNGVVFMFIKNPADDESGLIIAGRQLSDILGPTILFSPEQVKKGLFQKAVDNIKTNAGDVLPRLTNNGRAAGR